MRRLIAGLVIVIALFVVIDVVTRDFAEGRLAERLQTDLRLHERPDVSIGGFPFLVEVVRGRFTSVDIEADNVRSRGVRLSRVTLELRGVRFSLPELRARVDRGRGTAVITDDALTAALRRRGAPATVTFEGGRAFLSSDRLPQAVEADVFLEGATLVVSSSQVPDRIEVPLPRIARGVEYEAITVRGGEAELTFRVARSVLRPPASGGQVGGNGHCTHHGRSSTSMLVTHLTHQKPRRPGATMRAGKPCPGDSGAPPTRVARNNRSTSDIGKRRPYPVADPTAMLRPSLPSSRRSSHTPSHSCSANQPPVQSSTARVRSEKRAMSSYP